MVSESEYINDRSQRIAEFADKNEMRQDWHEPDEQEVTARVEGDRLDNAMGESGIGGEMVVVLMVDGKDTLRINLATLLACASYTFRKAGE